METIRTTADLSRGVAAVSSREDSVRLVVRDDHRYGTALFLPGEARALAAVLLRAADEAEG